MRSVNARLSAPPPAATAARVALDEPCKGNPEQALECVGGFEESDEIGYARRRVHVNVQCRGNGAAQRHTRENDVNRFLASA